MNIQWQARTFYSFGGNGTKDIIVYDVPVDGGFKDFTVEKLEEKIVNGKVVRIEVMPPRMLRVAVEFD